MGLESLGGSVPAPGRPVVVASRAGRVEAFAITSGGVMMRWTEDGGVWSGPTALAGDLRLPGSYPAGVALVDGTVHLFAIGAGGFNTGGPLVHWPGVSSAPQVYRDWSLNAQGNGLACCTWGQKSVHVFGLAPGGVLWKSWDATGAPLPPAPPLPGSAGRLFASAPVAVSTQPGWIDVFAVDAHRGAPLRWRWRGTAPASGPSVGAWRGPERIAGPVLRLGNGAQRPGNGFAAVARVGRVHLFGIATDARLWHWSLGETDTRSAVLPSGGYNLRDGVPAAVSIEPRVEVFAIGPGNVPRGGPLLRWRGDPTPAGLAWSEPVSLDGDLAAGGVGVVATRGEIDALAVGHDGTLNHWPAAAGARNGRWANWANTQPAPGGHVPFAHCHPTSREELVAVVREAERLGRRVRAVGSGWSFSDVAVTRDYVVETKRLNRVLTSLLDASPSVLAPGVAGRPLVHVEAGIELDDLMRYLDGRGWAVPTMGGASGQTLAGAVSTCVHGADFKLPPFPDMVRAIHMVGPGGAQYWIEPSNSLTVPALLRRALGSNVIYLNSDDVFDAALVSVGSLGIVYSYVIEVEPQYDLFETTAHLPWHELRRRLEARAPFEPPKVRCVQAAVDPSGTHGCFLITREQADATGPAPRRSVDPLGIFCHGGILDVIYQLAAGAVAPVVRATLPLLPPGAEFIPSVALPLLRAAGPGALGDVVGAVLDNDANLLAHVVTELTRRELPAGTRRGWAHTVMAGPNPGECATRGHALELAFDATGDAYLRYMDRALAILDEAFRTERLALGGWLSMRFVGPSRAILSPQRFARTCMVEAVGLRTLRSTEILLGRLEEAAPAFGGIPHWGMFSRLTAADVARGYPRLGTWRNVRRTVFTAGGTRRTFDNDFSVRCGLSEP